MFGSVGGERESISFSMRPRGRAGYFPTNGSRINPPTPAHGELGIEIPWSPRGDRWGGRGTERLRQEMNDIFCEFRACWLGKCGEVVRECVSHRNNCLSKKIPASCGGFDAGLSACSSHLRNY